MSKCYEAEARVLNGFPILVRFTSYSPEPDVGYAGGIEIDDILTSAGKPASFIRRQLSEREMQNLIEEIYWHPDNWSPL